MTPQSLAARRRRNDSEYTEMSLFETMQHRRGRVLFVSQTNACRGQMAEAFARALGDDVILAFSAGIWPADSSSEAARTAMAEGATPLFADQAPKGLANFDLSSFDVIVNLSGSKLPAHNALLLEPFVPAPLANDLDSHRDVRDRVERFVRFLVEHFRRAREWSMGVDHVNVDPAATPAPMSTEAARQTMRHPPPEAAPQPDVSMHAAF